MVNNIKSSSKQYLKLFFALIGVVAVIFIAWISWTVIIKPILTIVPEWGNQVTQEAINAPQFLVSLFGNEIFASWNALIVFLAIFFMLLFALADIINTFSTFNTGTSWILAGGLGIVGIMTGFINEISVILFGGAAAMGALGIALIIIWAIFISVFTNFILGHAGIKRMMEVKSKGKARQKEIDEAANEMKTGFGKLKEAAHMDDESQ